MGQECPGRGRGLPRAVRVLHVDGLARAYSCYWVCLKGLTQTRKYGESEDMMHLQSKDKWLRTQVNKVRLVFCCLVQIFTSWL
jgi:hypothetical protein